MFAMFMILGPARGLASINARLQQGIAAGENVFELINKRFGPGSVVHYYGGTLPEERDKALKNFKENPDCRFFVGTPATGGY